MPTLARHCEGCQQYHRVEIIEGRLLCCPNCKQGWAAIGKIDSILEHCPICQCRQFYLSKDFNQFIGCLIMLIGIVLVPKTYGLSLPFFALIDWILHKRVPTIINCYKCGTEFRHLAAPPHIKPFMHHIGLKYDKFRK